jgi:hypothetical protein
VSVGDLPFGIAIVWLLYRWLSDVEPEARKPQALGRVT